MNWESSKYPTDKTVLPTFLDLLVARGTGPLTQKLRDSTNTVLTSALESYSLEHETKHGSLTLSILGIVLQYESSSQAVPVPGGITGSMMQYLLSSRSASTSRSSQTEHGVQTYCHALLIPDQSRKGVPAISSNNLQHTIWVLNPRKTQERLFTQRGDAEQK